jgi:hypothetical protein
VDFSFRTKFVPAHERFAHLLAEKPSITEPSSTPKKTIASPADIRRYVQVTESERVRYNEDQRCSLTNGEHFFLVKKSFIQS